MKILNRHYYIGEKLSPSYYLSFNPDFISQKFIKTNQNNKPWALAIVKSCSLVLWSYTSSEVLLLATKGTLKLFSSCKSTIAALFKSSNISSIKSKRILRRFTLGGEVRIAFLYTLFFNIFFISFSFCFTFSAWLDMGYLNCTWIVLNRWMFAWFGFIFVAPLKQ